MRLAMRNRWHIPLLLFVFALSMNSLGSLAESDTTSPPRRSSSHAAKTAEERAKHTEQVRALGLRVLELTSKEYGSKIGDGNVWLIEFFTPWCRHCQNFATSYGSVAATFHSAPEEKIRVAKVDCSVEKALATRFGVQSYPSFFLVDGWSVYEFQDHRNEANLISFARGGYKKQQPIPFWISPMGPMGLLQGFLIYLGTQLMAFFEWIQGSYGISPFFAGVVLCGIGIFGGMCSIIILTILTTPKMKEN